MRVYLKSTKRMIDAVGEYNENTKELIVLKNSKVSSHVSEAEKFRGANTVIKQRNQYVKDTVVVGNVVFKSASTAANFVTGSSTNGLVAWKDENGKKLKDALGNQ